MDGFEKMVDGMCMTLRHDFWLNKSEPRDTDSFADSLSSGMTDMDREALRINMRQLIKHNVAPVIEQLERDLAEARKDAARYRWLAGADVPQHSTRWPRWKLEYYAGFHGGWQPMMGEDLDAAIDEAIEKDKP